MRTANGDAQKLTGHGSARRWCARTLLLTLLVLAGGCAHGQGYERRLLEVSPTNAGGIVFVADGAGNFQCCSTAVRNALHEADVPLVVHTFEWSHGYLRSLADQLSYQWAREQGEKLADMVRRFHQDYPEMPIYLVGHSAGSTVIISCLESLPENSVERAFLLAPSVSSDYDIRPALRAVERGLHVHYSKADWFYLGLASNWIGTADRHWSPTAGQVGFHLYPDSYPTGIIDKLEQHGWTPEDGLLGHLGGHYGCYQNGYLRRYVLPLLHERN